MELCRFEIGLWFQLCVGIVLEWTILGFGNWKLYDRSNPTTFKNVMIDLFPCRWAVLREYRACDLRILISAMSSIKDNIDFCGLLVL